MADYHDLSITRNCPLARENHPSNHFKKQIHHLEYNNELKVHSLWDPTVICRPLSSTVSLKPFSNRLKPGIPFSLVWAEMVIFVELTWKSWLRAYILWGKSKEAAGTKRGRHHGWWVPSGWWPDKLFFVMLKEDSLLDITSHNICDSRQGWQIQPRWHVVAFLLCGCSAHDSLLPQDTK